MFDPRVVHGREGIGDQNLHAQGDAERRQVSADAAVTDDAEAAAGELPPHHDLGFPSGVILRRRA